MNRFWWFVRGYLRVEVTGAGPDQVLNSLSLYRIPFWNVVWPDQFTAVISIFRRDLKIVERISNRQLCQICCSECFAVHELLRAILYRTCLWIMLLVACMIMLFLPQYVLFYEVEGNTSISDQEILRSLETLHIEFGAYGPDIQSQWVEDHLLNMIDRLQWVTINQSGVKAVVHVREREEAPKITNRKGFSNIVASRPAIITSQSIWSGQALREPGDIVLEGDLLVSGVVDLEKTYLITRAQGEIYGRTWRNIMAVIPMNIMQKGNETQHSQSIWLECGKVRIKLFGNSGIPTATYDKMINKKMLSLPGGYAAPFSICIETYLCRDLSSSPLEEMWGNVILSEAISAEVDAQMIAGEILSKREHLSTDGNLLRLSTFMECEELISRSVEANWIEEDY